MGWMLFLQCSCRNILSSSGPSSTKSPSPQNVPHEGQASLAQALHKMQQLVQLQHGQSIGLWWWGIESTVQTPPAWAYIGLRTRIYRACILFKLFITTSSSDEQLEQANASSTNSRSSPCLPQQGLGCLAQASHTAQLFPQLRHCHVQSAMITKHWEHKINSPSVEQIDIPPDPLDGTRPLSENSENSSQSSLIGSYLTSQ